MRGTHGCGFSGGIPICFPQFSDLGPLGQHGFARNSEWSVESTLGADVTELVLVLTSSEETLAIFRHPFELRFTVHLSDAGPGLTFPWAALDDPHRKAVRCMETAIH